MNKPAKKSLVPKLRFPEFREAGEWESKTLVELAKFRRGSFPQPYGLPEWYDDENGMPFVQVFDVDENLRLKEKTKNRISKIGAEQSVFIAQGTLIVTLQGSIGRVAVTQYDAYIDRTLLIFEEFFKPTEKLFFAYVIQNLFEIEKEKAPGGIIKTITKESLSDFVVKLPSRAEQQKIADCFSSLDDLISAQTQKIDALKTHKKGLMQQLFPAEGETIPKLRFPEFKEAGGWEEKELNNALDYLQPTKYLVNSTAYDDQYKTPVVTAGKTFILGYTNEITGIFEKNLPVIIFDDFTTASQYVDFPFKAKSSAMKILLAKEGANIKFVYESMQMIKYEVGAHERHWISTFSKIKVATPKKKEQQKIADCLSSLDDLISAQAQKIDALKNLKKGLMQQLFPAIDEVSA